MRIRTRLLVVVGALTVLAGCFFVLAGAGSPARGQEKDTPVPKTALNEIVREAVRNIERGLGKPAAKTSRALVRTNAFLIALAAQDGMKKGGTEAMKLATVRDAALKLADATTSKKIDVAAARAPAAVLAPFPDVKAGAAADTGPVDLKAKFDLGEIMNVFAKANKGGQEIEKDLLILGQQKRPFQVAQMSRKVELLAYKTAMLGPLVREDDESVKDKDKPREWRQLSDAMQASALQMAHAVRAKDGKQLKAAVKKLNASCTKCHDDFR